MFERSSMMKSKDLYIMVSLITKFNFVVGDRKSNDVRIKTTLANRLGAKALVLEHPSVKLLCLLYI